MGEIGAQFAARHGQERGEAVVAETGGDTGERLAICATGRSAQQAQTATPGSEGEAGLGAEHARQRAPAHANLISPMVDVERRPRMLDQPLGQSAKPTVSGHRQCERGRRSAGDLVQDQ